VLDLVSLGILAQDLEDLYRQLAERAAARLPAAGASFKAWSERLRAYSASPEIAAEADYWLGLPWSRVTPLPTDHERGANTRRSRGAVARTLSRRETARLLSQLPRDTGATVEEILLAAVAAALARWTGGSTQLLNVTGHGREPIFPDLDVSRTVGWLVCDHPLVIDLDGAAGHGRALDPRQALARVVAETRRVPHGGIGFGVLRYLASDPSLAARLSALPAPQVYFNYRGLAAGRREPPRGLLRPAAEAAGEFADPSAPRPGLLYVSARVVAERLRLTWTYSSNLHRRATIESLAREAKRTLTALVSASHPASSRD
jgi:non-ribosomal peptide synthase protein (TIGR01720 family)